MSSRYKRLEVSAADLVPPVHTVRIVIHTEGRQGSTMASNNHATQYLLLPSGRSVQLNIRHGEDDLNGIMEVVSRAYARSHSEIVHFDFIPSQQFTVRQVVELVFSNKLNDFCFSGGGMGCKYWQTIMLQLFQDRSWVPVGSAVELHSQLSRSYSLLRASQASPIRAGTFDEAQTQDIADNAWRSIRAQLRAGASKQQAIADDLMWIVTNAVTQPVEARIRYNRLSQLGLDLSTKEAMRTAWQSAVALRDRLTSRDNEAGDTFRDQQALVASRR